MMSEIYTELNEERELNDEELSKAFNEWINEKRGNR